MNPSSGDAAFAVDSSTSAGVDETIQRARDSVAGWAAMPTVERGRCLARAARLVARAEDLADLITSDVGKPITEARAEQARTVAILDYYAGLAQAPVGELYEDSAGEFVRVVRFPRGVAALITPWNFPLAIPAWKMAPALLAGNATVLKPAPVATRLASRLVAIMREVGVPRDACSIVAGDAAPGEELLSRRPDVVSFTGSLVVGRRIAELAGDLRIPLQLEMGGTNAVYVSSAANPDEAATILLAGAMSYAGQKCTATSRVLVHARRAAELSEALVQQVKLLPVGDPQDEATVVGPMISAAARDGAVEELNQAVGRGVQIDARGTQPDCPGYYFAPTLVSGGDSDDRVYREEVFAPILGVRPVASFEEGLSEVNATSYGLVAGIVSPKRSEVETFIRAASAGIIRVNAPTTGLEPSVPFGGAKDSSLGPREQGRAGLDFFSETHTIYG